MQTPSLQQLLEAGVHFGHQVNRWHPNMERYIYGSRDNIHIIDLLKTREQLTQAAAFLKAEAAQGKTIMFLGTKHQAQDIIREEAERCGMPYIEKRWIGGLLTNWEQMKRNLDKLVTYEANKSTNKLNNFTKKERLLMDRKMIKLNSELAGVKRLSRVPDILFVIDPKKELNAVLEASKLGLVIVALCDTNTNPQLVSIAIPGNDDSIKSLRLIVTTIADAIAEGRTKFEKAGDAAVIAPAAAEAVDGIVVNQNEILEAVVAEVEGIVKEVEEEATQQDASLIEEKMGSASKEAKKTVDAGEKLATQSEEDKAETKAEPKKAAKVAKKAAPKAKAASGEKKATKKTAKGGKE